MGEDTPEAVILTCPGCDTQFRLKPKKGRLPDGPVACPKCATDIPVVDSNLSEPADEAEVLQRATLSGKGPVAPAAGTPNKDAEFDGFPDDDHSFADINLSENASRKTGPKQTFLGMGPSSLKAVLGEETSAATPDEPTQLVDRDDLGALRESSAVDEDADDGGFHESPTSGRLRRPRQLDNEGGDEFNRETSEQKAVTPSDLRETAEGDAPNLRETAEGNSVEADLDEFDNEVDEPLAPQGLEEEEDTGPTQVSERPDFAKSPGERGAAEHTDDTDEEGDGDEKDKKSDSEDENDKPKTGASPKKAVLGKLKLKQKLAARLKKNKSKEKRDRDEASPEAPGDDLPEPAGVEEETESPDDSDAESSKSDDHITLDSEDQKTGKKPSLSELLKKAREKSKSGSGLPRPRQSTTRNQRPKPTGEKLDRALQDIADETAQALTDEESEGDEVPRSERTTERLGKVGGTERLDKVSGPESPGSGKRSSKEMMDLLRRKVAENDQPGAASERRGSGYIRLPTAEIQDVLGQGTYRLRVEDIVYEPVDKDGLTTLIKRGVLLGAAEIAEADGDWMPVQEHPVFHELRRKMAKEAHDLLADYRVEPDARAEAGEAAEPEQRDEAATESTGPSVPPPRPADGDASDTAEAAQGEPETETVSEAEAAGIPTMEADLDEDEAQVAEADHSFELPKSESSIEFPVSEVDQPEQDAAEQDVAEQEASGETDTRREDSSAGTPLSYPAIDPNERPEQAGEPSENAPEELAARTESGGGRRALIAVLALLAAGAVLAALALSPIGRPYLEKYVGPIGGSTDDVASEGASSKTSGTPDRGIPPKGLDTAVDAASSTIAEASDVSLTDAKDVSAMADRMAQSGDASAAATLLGVVHASTPDNTELTKKYIDLLLDSERYTDARREIAREVVRGADAAAYADAFAAATKSDPALGAYAPVTLAAGDKADAFRAYPKWERMTFQVVRDDTVTGIFKPSQAGWENGWRDEIAAWRLCEIMTCHFEIPRNRPARVSRSDLQTLVDAASGEEQERYRNQLDKLDWQQEQIGGNSVDVVYGTLQDWPGEWAPFPIELTDVWRPWLSVPGADLDKPTEQALAELKNVQDGRLYDALVDELDDATTRRMARELSTILVFDYLTNNWDRFVDDEQRYGVNNPFVDGHFVSINNGTAFQTRDSTRVKGRFGWTTRFSASTLASLELMSPDFVSSALYPDPTGLDEAKLEVFWEQRRRALERVDSLSRARGEDEVVAFD
jgi:predicted Zn finger-like uncharacterized protein